LLAIAAGEYITNLALKSDGTVWAWVVIHTARLVTERRQPCNASAGDRVEQRSGNRGRLAHSAALKSDGTVVVWGSIPYGLNGDPAAVSARSGHGRTLDAGQLSPPDNHHAAVQSGSLSG